MKSEANYIIGFDPGSSVDRKCIDCDDAFQVGSPGLFTNKKRCHECTERYIRKWLKLLELTQAQKQYLQVKMKEPVFTRFTDEYPTFSA